MQSRTRNYKNSPTNRVVKLMVSMSVKKKTTTVPKQNIVATVHGVEVPDGPHLLLPIVKAMNAGDFEHSEIQAGLGCILPGDRVVEMGSGSGAVGAVLAKNIKDLKVRSFEANPNLIDAITGLYRHNKLTRRIKVENKVVVAGADAPDAIDFYIQENFLGSSNSELTIKPESTKISASTIQYDTVRAEFPHNVLMIDIEGAELDFFEKADLSAIDMIIVEFHPRIYGRPGVRACRDYLEAQGFIRDSAFSWRQVRTFKKADRLYPAGKEIAPPQIAPSPITPMPNAEIPTFEIDPRRPIKDSIIHVKDAVLAHRAGSSGWRIKASVFDSERAEVPQAICWHERGDRATVPRDHPRQKRIKNLPGTWVFGGCYNAHFGHFLIESLARVWALDHIDEKIEGVLFFPVYDDHVETAPKLFDSMSSILDIDLNWKIVDDYYRVDRLIVPPQGSGIKNDLSSSPEYRAFLRDHIRRDLDPVPSKKLYISRSGFTERPRSILGEKQLEAHLEAEGYLIFHPQDHSLQDQVRHYIGADHILGPDGSPFHLVNFIGMPEKSVGVIQRRRSSEYRSMLDQTRWFGAGEAMELGFCKTYWAPAGRRRASLMMSAEVSFSQLCGALRGAGLISADANWPDLSQEETTAEVAATGASLGCDMHQVFRDSQSLLALPLLENGTSPQVFWHAQ
jgi:FkbM family methyltransferase